MLRPYETAISKRGPRSISEMAAEFGRCSKFSNFSIQHNFRAALPEFINELRLMA